MQEREVDESQKEGKKAKVQQEIANLEKILEKLDANSITEKLQKS